eukprot:3606738-Alexandrium_andersonii.AAC.1
MVWRLLRRRQARAPAQAVPAAGDVVGRAAPADLDRAQGTLARGRVHETFRAGRDRCTTAAVDDNHWPKHAEQWRLPPKPTTPPTNPRLPEVSQDFACCDQRPAPPNKGCDQQRAHVHGMSFFGTPGTCVRGVCTSSIERWTTAEVRHAAMSAVACLSIIPNATLKPTITAEAQRPVHLGDRQRKQQHKARTIKR